MCQPSRRTFVATAAALSLGGTGCLGRSTDQRGSAATETTAATTRTATTHAALDTEQTVGGVPVRVSNVSVRDALLYLDTPDSMAVANPDGARYVLVSVSGGESGPPPERFSLVVDGEAADVAAVRGGLDDYGPRYDPGYAGEEGYLPFVVPSNLDADEARIVLEYEGKTAAWRLETEHLDALRRPKATFELRTVELPARILPGEPVEVRVVAENVSETAGAFKGVLNVANLGAAYVPYAFERDADPGEGVTWEKTLDDRPPDGVDSVGFFLYTVGGDRERQVPVGVGTAAGTATVTDGQGTERG